jgi:hypothetical protein
MRQLHASMIQIESKEKRADFLECDGEKEFNWKQNYRRWPVDWGTVETKEQAYGRNIMVGPLCKVLGEKKKNQCTFIKLMLN